MEAEEYLKSLDAWDPVFDDHDSECEYTEEQLINFAARYHARKMQILKLQKKICSCN